MGGHTTGLTVRTLIPARRLAVVIHVSFITPAIHVLSSVMVRVRKAICASSHTVCSSAGSIRLATVLSRVRTASSAAGESASSPTLLNSFGSCRRVTMFRLTQIAPSHTTVLRVDWFPTPTSGRPQLPLCTSPIARRRRIRRRCRLYRLLVPTHSPI